jgi:hypothetical protein
MAPVARYKKSRRFGCAKSLPFSTPVDTTSLLCGRYLEIDVNNHEGWALMCMHKHSDISA